MGINQRKKRSDRNTKINVTLLEDETFRDTAQKLGKLSTEESGAGIAAT